MINDFLARLDNDPTPPRDFCWPSFTARQLYPVEQRVRAAIMGASTSREARFQRALQLADLVACSPLAQYLDARDSRRTYDRRAIEARLAGSGTLIQYFGARQPAPEMSFVVTPRTPGIYDLALEVIAPDRLVVVDDAGKSTEYPISYYDPVTHVTNWIETPGGALVFTTVALAAGDQWVMNYRAPGVSWVQQALVGMRTIDPSAIVSSQLTPWLRSPVELDHLAAVVVALTGP